MKKYIKPELFYERYELSQHIADCAWELQFADDQNCIAIPDQDDYPDHPNLFTDYDRCGMTPDALEAYCYHNGADGVNVFAS